MYKFKFLLKKKCIINQCFLNSFTSGSISEMDISSTMGTNRHRWWRKRRIQCLKWRWFKCWILGFERKKWEVLKNRDFSYLERKITVLCLSVEGRFRKHTSISCSQLAITRRQGFPSVTGKSWPLQNTEPDETKPARQTYATAHHNQHASTGKHFCKTFVNTWFSFPWENEEAQALLCLTSVALEECRMVDDK